MRRAYDKKSCNLQMNHYKTQSNRDLINHNVAPVGHKLQFAFRLRRA
jgi:hypothetical protein